MTPPQPWIYFFGEGHSEAEPDLLEELGGKGASLAALSRAGLPVPPGFTISTRCCRYVLQHDGRWPEGLEEQVREHLARLEGVTGRSFGRGPHPLLVSVRSGAAVSMPGMMDTILNCGLHPDLADAMGDAPHFWSACVQLMDQMARSMAGVSLDPACGHVRQQATRGVAQRCLRAYADGVGRAFSTDPWAMLVECIDAVFRSWNSPRAAAYRERHGIRGLPGTAVTVQAMFPAAVSGVLFTQDPNRPEDGRMVIESSYGLGAAVVSGDGTPDRFRVRRDDFARFQACAGVGGTASLPPGDPGGHSESLSLSAGQVAELCALGMKIESLFHAPMDIEWAWADGRFALLQCRPVAGLDVARDMEAGRQEEIARLRALAAADASRRSGGKRRLWVAHNLGETLPAPTPLTWDILRHFMSGAGGFGLMYRDFGYRPSAEVRQHGFLELICGRVYADPARLAELFWEGMPLVYDLAAVPMLPSFYIGSGFWRRCPRRQPEGFAWFSPCHYPARLRRRQA
jgi:phosphoenolpyruvate synthase/pyruvate phosphate dikinase